MTVTAPDPAADPAADAAAEATMTAWGLVVAAQCGPEHLAAMAADRCGQLAHESGRGLGWVERIVADGAPHVARTVEACPPWLHRTAEGFAELAPWRAAARVAARLHDRRDDEASRARMRAEAAVVVADMVDALEDPAERLVGLAAMVAARRPVLVDVVVPDSPETLLDGIDG